VTTTIKDPWDEEQPTGLSVSAPQAAAYQFQSGGVIDMLKKLKDKFSDERTTLEKEEMSQKQSYELLIQDLTDSVERATKAKGRKEKTRGARQEDAANAKGVQFGQKWFSSGEACLQNTEGSHSSRRVQCRRR